MSLPKFDKLKQNTTNAMKVVQGKIEDLKDTKAVKSIQEKFDDIKNSKVIKTINEKTEDFKNQTVTNVEKIKDSKIVKGVGSTFTTISTNEDVLAVWNKIAEISTKVGKTSLKGLKVITGISAVTNRKQAIKTKEEAEALKAEIETTNESIREDLNEMLEIFGKIRLETLHNTIGRFLHYLASMAIIPVIVLFVMTQKYFVAGVSSSGIKG